MHRNNSRPRFLQPLVRHCGRSANIQLLDGHPQDTCSGRFGLVAVPPPVHPTGLRLLERQTENPTTCDRITGHAAQHAFGTLAKVSFRPIDPTSSSPPKLRQFSACMNIIRSLMAFYRCRKPCRSSPAPTQAPHSLARTSTTTRLRHHASEQ